VRDIVPSAAPLQGRKTAPAPRFAGNRRQDGTLIQMESDRNASLDHLDLLAARASIGAALRVCLAVTDPPPDRIVELLRQLDDAREVSPVRQYTDNA
jgi:hypothetical protein